jgi:hypothetical protein
MTITCVAGYYGYETEEGMNYDPLPLQVLVLADQFVNGLSITDVTNGSNDPQDGRRVWHISGITQSGVDALSANLLTSDIS